jgi:hypothetical protein
MKRIFSPRWYIADNAAFVTLAMLLHGLGSIELAGD